MAVQTAVFRRAIAQIMGRVKAEFLRDLDHGSQAAERQTYKTGHIGFWAFKVKDRSRINAKSYCHRAKARNNAP